MPKFWKLDPGINSRLATMRKFQNSTHASKLEYTATNGTTEFSIVAQAYKKRVRIAFLLHGNLNLVLAEKFEIKPKITQITCMIKLMLQYRKKLYYDMHLGFIMTCIMNASRKYKFVFFYTIQN